VCLSDLETSSLGPIWAVEPKMKLYSYECRENDLDQFILKSCALSVDLLCLKWNAEFAVEDIEM
jgi:hypothetical protein